jgi:type IV secretion system protein VirD4
MKKGNFIVMKTGTHPFISKLKLFFDWGINFDAPKYQVKDNGAREVHYTCREKIENAIKDKLNTMNQSQSNMPPKANDSKRVKVKREVTEEEIEMEVIERQNKRISCKKNSKNSQQIHVPK